MSPWLADARTTVEDLHEYMGLRRSPTSAPVVRDQVLGMTTVTENPARDR